ncbi:MAG: protein kinase [Gemmatimonadaceae bacterium]|nr:protein kinase [Gemmatimonadaceae bacterium]
MSTPSHDPPDPIATLRAALDTRYALGHEVGAGGMSLVLLAHDRRHDRPVAVKVLRPEVALTLGAERFLREIGTAARLQHPHIVPIYDSGDAAGMLYLVMPYVDGESLRERLARVERLALDEALRYGREVGEALSYAHSRHVVHRDMKPENILLQHGHAFVVDFGIAKALEGDASTTTQEGMFVGTPTYMAPEQMFGEGDVDERADVYGLATVLYEALEGRPPFSGPSATAILAQKAVGTVLAPSRTLEPLPPHVERALLRALHRDRDERPATIEEFITTLTQPAPVRPAARRSGATVLKSIAVLPFTNASGDPADEYLGDGLAEDLGHALSAIPALRVVARTSAFAFKGRAVDARTVGATLGVGSILSGSVRRAGDRLRITCELIDVESGIQRWSERFDRQLTDVFAVQDEISHAIVDTLRVRFLGETSRIVATPTSNLDAYESYLRGRFEWSQRTPASLQRCLEHLERAIALDPRFVLALAGLADCHVTRAIYGVASPTEALGAARTAADRALAIRADAVEALTARASVRALHDRDWDGAEGDYLAALAGQVQYPLTHQWYAMHLLAPLGRFAEARAQVARARELDPLSPSIAASGGILRLYEGDAEQAVRELHLVLEQHPAFGLAHLFSGLALVETGRLDDALAAIDRAVALSNGSAESRAALGFAQARAGRADAARATLADLERLRATQFISPVLLAQVRVGLGDTAAALADLAEARAVRAVDLPLVRVRPAFAPLLGLPALRALLDAPGSAVP